MCMYVYVYAVSLFFKLPYQHCTDIWSQNLLSPRLDTALKERLNFPWWRVFWKLQVLLTSKIFGTQATNKVG